MVASLVMYTILAISGLLGSAIAVEDLKRAFARRSRNEPDEAKSEKLTSCRQN